MSRFAGRWMVIIAVVVLALCAPIAEGTAIQNLVRIKGLETNVLVGLGLVIGLNGTGDESKSSFVAARPFAEFLRNLGNPIQNLEELAEADSYALVQVSMTIPGMRYETNLAECLKMDKA